MHPKFVATLRERFAALSPRERQMVVIMVAVVAFSLLFGLYSWQAKANARLDKVLPQARTQLAALQDASAEITRLRAQTRPAQLAPTQLIDALQSAATQSQLTLTIRSIDGGLIQISGQGVSFDAWVTWLSQVQGRYALRLTGADITQDGGAVRIEAQLSTTGTR